MGKQEDMSPAKLGVLRDFMPELEKSLLPLELASTLPPVCYTSQDWYDLEVERIFMKEWLCVGRVDQVENVGDYFTIDLIGEPLVVIRDEENQVQCLSRVCRHRAAEVIEPGEGNTKRLRCRYHFWTYDYKGQLIGVPEMADTAGFDRKDVCLPKLRVEIWEGFIFVTFNNDADSLGPKLAPLSKHLRNYRLAELKSFVLEKRPSEQFPPAKFNWKLLMDNFEEFYHVLGLHSGSHDPMPTQESKAADYNDIYCHSWGHIPGAISEGKTLWSPTGANSIIPKMEGLSKEEQELGQFFLIYPNTLFFVSPELVGYYQVLPRGPGEVELTLRTLYRPETVENLSNFEAARIAAEANLAFINNEDMWACESMQRSYNGILTQRSRMQGRLSKWEKPVNNIARWVVTKVLGEDAKKA